MGLERVQRWVLLCITSGLEWSKGKEQREHCGAGKGLARRGLSPKSKRVEAGDGIKATS